MNFEDFISKMKKEKVSFSFKKKDGTIREANGTLCSDYIPASEFATYHVSNIVWNLDGDTTLPKSFNIQIKNSDIEEGYTVDDYVADYIKEKYGFKVNYFNVNKITRSKPIDNISYYDLDKSDWRSFNKNQFIGIKEA